MYPCNVVNSKGNILSRLDFFKSGMTKTTFGILATVLLLVIGLSNTIGETIADLCNHQWEQKITQLHFDEPSSDELMFSRSPKTKVKGKLPDNILELIQVIFVEAEQEDISHHASFTSIPKQEICFGLLFLLQLF